MSDFEQTRAFLSRRLGLTYIHAVLGDANGVVYPDPVNRPDLMNVRYKTAAGLSLPPALPVGPNYVGQDTPGTPVICRYDNNGQLVIWGNDIPGQRANGFNPIANNPAASVNQRTTPTDTILPLLSHCTSPVSLKVVVRSFFYVAGRLAYLFDGAQVDLSSYVPSAGNHRIVGLFLKEDNTIEISASTTQSLLAPFDLSDYQECVTGASIGSTPIWFWHLHDAQTTITDDDRLLDGRQIVNSFALGSVRFVQTQTVTVANTTTETALTGSGSGSLTLPANYLTAGKALRIRASGYLSDNLTPTLRLRVSLGGTPVFDTSAVTLLGSLSNNYWELQGEIICRVTGASGTIIGQARFVYDDATHAGTLVGMVNTATISADTTQALAVGLTAQWGTASASNSLTCTNLVVEGLN